MSLMQHGSQTARNSTTNIPSPILGVIAVSMFMSMCDDDAHVLMRTWAACGHFVRGIRKAIITPNIAAGVKIDIGIRLAQENIADVIDIGLFKMNRDVAGGMRRR